MKLTITITDAGEENVEVTGGDAGRIPESPGRERSKAALSPPEPSGRHESKPQAEPKPSAAASVAPPMQYQPSGSPESPTEETSIVSPPSQFGVRHGSRHRR